jgi:hypothetical protein
MRLCARRRNREFLDREGFTVWGRQILRDHERSLGIRFLRLLGLMRHRWAGHFMIAKEFIPGNGTKSFAIMEQPGNCTDREASMDSSA